VLSSTEDLQVLFPSVSSVVFPHYHLIAFQFHFLGKAVCDCLDWQLSVRTSSRSVKGKKCVHELSDVAIRKVPLPS